MICYRAKTIPKDCTDTVRIHGAMVHIQRQKVGKGSRRLLVCPCCGKGRLHLYVHQDALMCRECLPFDLYQYRRNMYDSGGTELLKWNMHKLLASVGIHQYKYPFDYLAHAFDRPRYMPHEKFSRIMKKVQMLENMRFAVNFAGKRFNAAEIKYYISDEFLQQYDFLDLRSRVLFATEGECMSRLR